MPASEVSPSSPPMPVINNVFSLAPYRDYLEGTEGSAQVPFCREHPQGDTPPRNMGGRREPTALRESSPAGSAASQPGSREGSPGGVGSGEPPPEDIVLDLSLKKRLEKAGETQGPVGRTEGTPDTGDVEEEKDGPGGKVRVGEGAKPGGLPLLIEVGSGDKSNFQSSATFMFKKYKILRSRLPATVPPRPASSPCAPQPSPPSHKLVPQLCRGLAQTPSSPHCPKPPVWRERRASCWPGSVSPLARRPPPASISAASTPCSATLFHARCPGPPRSSCGSG
ncbi:hypothetical protein llap_19257 [Limosa lapponica baueri]|uniref:Uncharacterized protein n=1 Tax=Limosa lapponica baueri TaxID=1758121 RepID=A0A2I0T9H3_LIMLA|nr:hypothetical protein llap_19257 [Limosa lapponica baueri]